MIPSLSDLTGDDLTHRFEDTFNPPGLTNFLGAAQVDHDLVAVRSVNFPPLTSGDTIIWSISFRRLPKFCFFIIRRFCGSQSKSESSASTPATIWRSKPAAATRFATRAP